MGAPDAGSGGQQYFAAEPEVASTRRRVRLALPDLDLELVTDRGVFSGEAVDPGTKLLLVAAPGPPGGAIDLLDLGCGYGAVAVALAVRAPAATVWAVDVNRRALALTAQNAAGAGVGGRVRAVEPEEVPASVRFAAIYTNPPIRVGKAALHDLLGLWLARLSPGGRAWLVVHKHLGSDSLGRWLASEGWAVERVVSRMGYRVLGLGPSGPLSGGLGPSGPLSGGLGPSGPLSAP